MFRFVADVSYVAIAMVGTYASRCVITIIRYACFEFEFTNVGSVYLALYSLMQATISKNNCKSIKALLIHLYSPLYLNSCSKCDLENTFVVALCTSRRVKSCEVMKFFNFLGSKRIPQLSLCQYY